MTVTAVLLAAGSSERFGKDKLKVLIGGKPVWLVSFEALADHPDINSVGVVTSECLIDEVRGGATGAAFIVKGGKNRTESARLGFENVVDADIVLFHDAARPFVSADVISNVIKGVEQHGAAFASVPVTDTIKRKSDGSMITLDRNELVAAQTPQGALYRHFEKAFESGNCTATDDMALLEAIGVTPVIAQGSPDNVKLTTVADMSRMSTAMETRTGIGYDIHRFSEDPARPLWLGGVQFVGEEPGLEGHSDADAVLHAVVDALLGAASLGDIGEHYPNTDPRWKDEPSGTFLKESTALLRENGWDVVNIDVSVLAERPMIMVKRDEIRSKIAELSGIGPDRVGVKATTNEGLGAIGRGEGIAAYAVATIKRRT